MCYGETTVTGLIFGLFRPLVDRLITERIAAFYLNLVKKGQITETLSNGPKVS